MGWFSFSKTSKEETEALAGTTVSPHLWVGIASEKDYQDRLSGLLAEYNALHSNPNGEPCWLGDLNKFVEALTLRLRKIDRPKLNPRQRDEVADILSHFSWIIGRLETELTIRGVIGFTLFKPLSERVYNYTSVVGQMPRRVTASTTVEEADKGVAALGEAAGEKLAEVEKLISEVMSNAKHSIEDEFFIEQAVQSYIPDSIRMLKNFSSAPEDMREQATELFVKQLVSIETRLQSITEQYSETSLAQMQAHALFLEEKTL